MHLLEISGEKMEIGRKTFKHDEKKFTFHLNLLDKNLEETINQFSSLSSGEYFFASWIEQAEYYIEVTNILNKILD